MGLPLFSASDDPGPSFFHFAQSSGLTPPVSNASAASAHATTVIAVRYDGGVVMVGDRQATGNYIASRDVRKIEAADRFTAIAISGTAARGIEFIRMAQLSFEHYEKMTDTASASRARRTTSRQSFNETISLRRCSCCPCSPVGRCPAGGANLRIRRRRGLLRTLRFLDDRFGTPFAKEPCDSALTPRWTVTQPSSSARWRCTKRATTTRAPGDRTSYGTSFHDRHNFE